VEIFSYFLKSLAILKILRTLKTVIAFLISSDPLPNTDKQIDISAVITMNISNKFHLSAKYLSLSEMSFKIISMLKIMAKIVFANLSILSLNSL